MADQTPNGVGNADGNVGNGTGTGGSSINDNSSNADSGKKQSVDYDSFQKLLDQKKKVQAEAAELKAKFEAMERDQKIKNEEYKALYESTLKEKQDAENKYKGLHSARIEDFKINAFMRALPSELISVDYLAHANLDGILYDEETGVINPESVKKVADDFTKKHPQLLKTSKKFHLPNDAANTSGAKAISHSEWLKLSGKEKITRMPDVIEFQKFKNQQTEQG
jgi:hypothetical protein